MGDLLAQLVPEIIGLIVTPASIVACLLLLSSERPYRNVAVFGGTALAVYALLGAVALFAGRAIGAHETQDPTTVRGWISLAIGVLFLVGGTTSFLRRPPRQEAAAADHLPGWARKLAAPTLPILVGGAVVLALLNPNVVIFFSGMGMVMTADLAAGQHAIGILVLVVASILDYVVPTLIFAVSGDKGRGSLRAAQSWLVRHDRIIGAVLLLVFGLMFTVRGLSQVTG